MIGDGSRIKAWSDRRLLEDKCIVEYDLNIPNDIINASVCDLVNMEGGWNWQLMDEWLHSNFKLCINAILPPMVDNEDDKFMIDSEEDGSFFVKNMYVKLMQEGDADGNNIWNHIWSMKVPERVKCFIWILMHDRHLTNYRLSSWGFGSSSCSLYGNVCESTLHLLRDCKFVRSIWDNRVPGNIKQTFFGSNLHDWPHINIMANPGENNEWCNY